jgi:WD40 repeat protein
MRQRSRLLFWSATALTTLVVLGCNVLPNWGQRAILQLEPAALSLPSADNSPRMEDVGSNLAISPDGNLLVANGMTESLQIHRRSDGQPLLTLRDGNQEALVTAIAFSPDSKTIAGSLFNCQRSHQIILWDTQSGNVKQRLIGHSGAVMAMAFSSDGKLLASGSNDKTIKIWDVQTSKLQKTVQTSQSVEAVSFSTDLTIIRSADNTGTVQQWQIKTGKLLQTLDNPQNKIEQYGKYAVGFSPDGKLMARADRDQAIRLWNLETGKLLLSLPGHHSSAHVVNFSPNSLLLASMGGSGDHEITTGGNFHDLRLWDIQTGQLVAASSKNQYSMGLIFDPRLNTLVTAGRGGVNLWKIDAVSQDRSGSSTPLK